MHCTRMQSPSPPRAGGAQRAGRGKQPQKGGRCWWRQRLPAAGVLATHPPARELREESRPHCCPLLSALRSPVLPASHPRASNDPAPRPSQRKREAQQTGCCRAATRLGPQDDAGCTCIRPSSCDEGGWGHAWFKSHTKRCPGGRCLTCSGEDYWQSACHHGPLRTLHCPHSVGRSSSICHTWPSVHARRGEFLGFHAPRPSSGPVTETDSPKLRRRGRRSRTFAVGDDCEEALQTANFRKADADGAGRVDQEAVRKPRRSSSIVLRHR